jgi:4-amino-4-deoxychorismate mutase
MKGELVSTMNGKDANDRLVEIRQALDEIDRRIAESISDRFDAVRQIGQLKRMTGIPMMQKSRVETVFSRATQFEADYNIPAGTLTAIFSTLVAEACRLEDGIIAQDSQ